ncbi:MAG: hypothetical protein JWO50_820 [Candidatus Kaiserbacteria bacterium]|nr:hypothetical protein [Candidatus Kaiserbacteria bacterium]
MKTDVYMHMSVKNLLVSKAFFEELGFTTYPRLTSDDCLCMNIEDNIYCMFVSRDFFAKFSEKDIVDAHLATESLVCISAESRGEVDEWVNKALFLGATENLVPEMKTGGNMYSRSFSDLDGHIWEIMWMDLELIHAV